MRYEIVFSLEAAEDYKRLKADIKGRIRDGVEKHLRHDPASTSRSRIKKLSGRLRPQYRLRIEEYRVYYDVTRTTVEILAILTKSESDGWLKKAGEKK